MTGRPESDPHTASPLCTAKSMPARGAMAPPNERLRALSPPPGSITASDGRHDTRASGSPNRNAGWRSRDRRTREHRSSLLYRRRRCSYGLAGSGGSAYLERRKLGMKRSVLAEGYGIPLGGSWLPPASTTRGAPWSGLLFAGFPGVFGEHGCQVGVKRGRGVGQQAGDQQRRVPCVAGPGRGRRVAGVIPVR